MAKEKEELNLKKIKVEEKKVASSRKTATKTTKAKEEKSSVSAAKKETNKTTKTTTKPKTTKKTTEVKVADAKKVNTKTKDADVKKVDTKTKKASTKTKTADTKKASAKTDDATKVSTKTKSTDAKKTSTKAKNATSKKSTNTKKDSSKTKNSSKSMKEKSKKVTPNTEIKKEEKVKEETIIEKIKNFIAKIVAMQEEAKNEELAKKEKKKKVQKESVRNELGVLESSSYLPEYYDLPYRYNETVVKILAQTPKRIFVYWDVADEDKTRYVKAFGNDFFEKTYPVLLVHNDDKNYTKEIQINDFANSWYINIDDPKTKYTIQLGRKFRQIPTNIDIRKIEEQNIILRTDYIPIAQSNLLEVPNNRILFNEMPTKITYRNVKTFEEKEKVVAEMKTPYGIWYNVKEFYKNNYKNEIDEEILDLNNPTSGALSSSSFK